MEPAVGSSRAWVTGVGPLPCSQSPSPRWKDFQGLPEVKAKQSDSLVKHKIISLLKTKVPSSGPARPQWWQSLQKALNFPSPGRHNCCVRSRSIFSARAYDPDPSLTRPHGMIDFGGRDCEAN